jgi:hypothetical protein
MKTNTINTDEQRSGNETEHVPLAGGTGQAGPAL